VRKIEYVNGIMTHLITEHLDLTIAPVERHGFAVAFVERVDLDVQRQTFDTLLVAEIGAQTLDTYVDLKIGDFPILKTMVAAMRSQTLTGSSAGFQ